MNKEKRLGIKHYIAWVIVAACILAMALRMANVISLNDAQITLIILLMASVLLVTEVIPLALGAMTVPIATALTGGLSVNTAFSGFANENVILFGAMFIIGGAMFRTGVAKTIGEMVVRCAGGSKQRLILYVMIVTAVLSSVMSNTGTTAVLLPVCMGIADSAKMDRKYLLLPLAYMACLGGMITMVGTPPNMTVAALLQEYGYDGFGFLEFAYIGIPLSVLGCVYMFFVYHRKLKTEAGGIHVEIPEEDLLKIGGGFKLDRRQKMSLIILIAVVIVMATGTVNLTLGAVIGAMACVLLGLVNQKEAIEDIDWTTMFLFSGMLPLADALESTGAGQIIADQAIGIIGNHTSDPVILTVLFVLAAVLTQFMSNTATCALLAPIGLEIAVALGASPKAVLIVIAAASSSSFATPMAVPPNTLVMGPAKAKFTDFVKLGVPLVVVCYLACIVIVPMVWPFFP